MKTFKKEQSARVRTSQIHSSYLWSPLSRLLACTNTPNDVHPNVEQSSRTLRSSAIQQNVNGLTNGGREKDAPEALFTTQTASSTPSESTSSPDRIKPNASSVPHSAYPDLPPSEGESLDKLSTRAVGDDTPVSSLSTSVGYSDSENNSSRKGAAGIEQHAPRPIFSEEHGRALGTQRGWDADLTDDAIAGGATAAGVSAAKERDEKDGTRFQHSTSPGIAKSSRSSGTTRKLHKSAGHSLSGGRTEETSASRAPADLPAGAAFPQSTYVVEDRVGASQDLSKDPLLAPLPVSRGGSGIAEPTPTPTPALSTGSPEHKHHKLTKKHSPTAGATPRVSDSPIRSSPENVGTSREDVDTKGAHAYKAPRKGAPETGHHTHINEHTPKPKLMDRIKGEVKIMQGTLRGDEGKKMEGRMLKEFGSF